MAQNFRFTATSSISHVCDQATAAEFARMARTDGDGRSLKLSSNILKDGSWVGLREAGALGPPNVPG